MPRPSAAENLASMTPFPFPVKHAGGGGGSNRMQSQVPVSNRFLLEERLPPRWVRDDVLLDLVGSPELPGYFVPIPAPGSQGFSSQEFRR